MESSKQAGKANARAPHFVDPYQPGKMAAVAPGMRFRTPDGKMVVTPSPKIHSGEATKAK